MSLVLLVLQLSRPNGVVLFQYLVIVIVIIVNSLGPWQKTIKQDLIK
jgi:hypothetical protein